MIHTAVRRILAMLAASPVIGLEARRRRSSPIKPAGVRWCHLNGDYSLRRARVASDGTVYVSMVNGKFCAKRL